MLGGVRREDVFDLRIATVEPGEAPPPDAHLVRIADPSPERVRERVAAGWHYKPCAVTYVLPRPESLEAYVAGAFRAGSRNKPRKLLREVPRRYRLEADEGAARLGEFRELYRRTIASRPRGRDRLSEREGGSGPSWTGLYLFDGASMVAGILVHALRDRLSVAYGGFDPGHRELDLEHFLIMQAIGLLIRDGRPLLSLGMDTNRYGHHLGLGLPAYKLRIGFTPAPWEPSGRELLRIQSFEVFEAGLFFYVFGAEGLEGRLFTRGEPDLRPFGHAFAPPVAAFRIGEEAGSGGV
jgi:hypothetical protein